MLHQLKKCYSCLWGGHSSRECRNDKAKCRVCKGLHHSALCHQIDQSEERKESKNEALSSEAVVVNHVSHNHKNEVLSAIVVVTTK